IQCRGKSARLSSDGGPEPPDVEEIAVNTHALHREVAARKAPIESRGQAGRHVHSRQANPVAASHRREISSKVDRVLARSHGEDLAWGAIPRWIPRLQGPGAQIERTHPD